nr:hypothetical protein [Burkholderia cepacia]
MVTSASFGRTHRSGVRQHATFDGQTSIAGNRAPSTIQIIRHARLQMRDRISELQIRIDIHQRPFLAFIAETDRGDFRGAQPTGEELVWQAVGPARRIDPGPTYPAARYRQSEFLMEFTQHACFGRLVTFPASAGQVPQAGKRDVGLVVTSIDEDVPVLEERNLRTTEGGRRFHA